MCHVLNRVAQQSAPSEGPGRRHLLKTLGAATAAGALLPLVSTGTAAAASRRHRTRLVLLGTAGGQAWLDGGRCGVSSAVVYGDSVYLVDLGHGAMHRLVQSGLGAGGGPGSALSPVHGIFPTHLHSDHVADWPALFATGPTDIVGRGDDAIQVFCPGDRGALPGMFPPGAPVPAVFNPERPTPGITAMTAYFSGDTCVSANLIDLARDADVLVHEVIDPRFVDQLVAALPESQRDAMREHLLPSHSTKYSGQRVVGEDLLTLGVGRT